VVAIRAGGCQLVLRRCVRGRARRRERRGWESLRRAGTLWRCGRRLGRRRTRSSGASQFDLNVGTYVAMSPSLLVRVWVGSLAVNRRPWVFRPLPGPVMGAGNSSRACPTRSEIGRAVGGPGGLGVSGGGAVPPARLARKSHPPWLDGLLTQNEGRGIHSVGGCGSAALRAVRPDDGRGQPVLLRGWVHREKCPEGFERPGADRRQGIETSDKLGRHRWVIERAIAWLTGSPSASNATPTTTAPSSPSPPPSPASRNVPHETPSNGRSHHSNALSQPAFRVFAFAFTRKPARTNACNRPIPTASFALSTDSDDARLSQKEVRRPSRPPTPERVSLDRLREVVKPSRLLRKKARYMNRNLFTGLLAVFAVVVSLLSFQSTASAAVNQTIGSAKLQYNGGHVCLSTASRVQLSPGRWKVEAASCQGAGTWHRRDNGEIRKANTAQCLDSNSSGEVYFMQCNGGTYQRWTYSSGAGGTLIRNVATKNYITLVLPYPGTWNWYEVRGFAAPQDSGNLAASGFAFRG
jgi:hypothetical protein